MKKTKRRRMFLRAEKDLLGWNYHPSMWRTRHWGAVALREYQRHKWEALPVEILLDNAQDPPQQTVIRACDWDVDAIKIIHDDFPRLVFELTWKEETE